MGDSRERLREFPDAVRFEIGQALYQAELGERHPSACAMQGLTAVEIVSDYRGDTYRGGYTTRLIRRRLAEAELHFRAVAERKG
jgi:phage-related protein